MKQESIISSCQASGPSPGLGCIFEAADTLLQSERQRLLSEVCACSPRPPRPSVYNDPPLPRLPRSPGGTSGKESACQCRRHKRCRFDPLGLKDPLGKDVATHSSILAWRIPWTEEPGGLPSNGSHRVEYDGSNSACKPRSPAAQPPPGPPTPLCLLPPSSLSSNRDLHHVTCSSTPSSHATPAGWTTHPHTSRLSLPVSFLLITTF